MKDIIKTSKKAIKQLQYNIDLLKIELDQLQEQIKWLKNERQEKK
jgi:hypothetical protein